MNHMKNIVLTIFLLSLFIKGIAQILTVIDRDTRLPLDLVTISTQEPNLLFITNSKGQVDLAPAKNAGIFHFQILGYETLTLNYSQIADKKFLIALSPGAISLDQVVVSRWRQDLREIPAHILTITPKQVALQNPQTAADLLSGSGEIFMQKSQQGGGSPMIRGFSTNRLLYTVDGVRMNTAIFRSGNLQNVISLDPFAMEGVEVIFGPVSLIYGSDAIGSVMSFQTLIPEYTVTNEPMISGNAVGRYASANSEKSGHFDVHVGWKKWAMVTSFSSNSYDDLRMGSYGPDEYLRNWYVKRVDNTDVVVENEDPMVQNPTGYSQMNLMQKLAYKPNKNWEIQYGVHYSATTNYARYDRLLRTKNGLPRSAEWYYGPQKWMMHNLSVHHTNPTAFYDEMTLRLAYQFFEESRIDRDFQKTVRFHRTEKVAAYSANLDFIKKLGQSNQLFYGFEAVIDEVISSGLDEDISNDSVYTGPSRYPQSTWSSYAAYASWQHRFSKQVLVQAGARYNLFKMKADFTNNKPYYPFPFTDVNLNNGAVTGNLGLVYNPAVAWAFTINLSTGFRAPNVDDLGKVFDSEPGSVVVPNPDLKPEYAYNGEIGIARVFGEKAKIDLAAYYTVLKNAMVRRNFSLNGQDSIMYDGEMSKVQAMQNAANANVYGIQLGLEAKLGAGFGAAGQFNFQKGEEELDNGTKSPLRHAAPWFGIAHLTYNHDRLKIDLYSQFNGEVSYENMPEEERGKDYMYAKDDNGNPYSPAWITFNIKTMYQVNDNLMVSAGIENLGDVRYRPYSSGLVAPGRNFIISLNVKF